ncbi:unnamed protein product [Clonostachys solani]|uniref:Protein kinase domain-containing protein n=1 Tax=Clonostachys solani TaxID=160281 RepID=A0A9N9Z9C3_9HYPO|nr:unnamed protein product [Clonostachys solani]
MEDDATGMLGEHVASPIWDLVDFTYHPEYHDARLVILCKGQMFVIDMDPDYFSDSLDQKEKYLFYIQVADEGEINGFVEEDFWDWAVAPLMPILEALPPSTGLESVHDFLFAKCTQYKLCAGPSGPIATLDEQASSYGSSFRVSLSERECAPFRAFSPSAVKIFKGDISPPSHWGHPETVLLPDGTIAHLRLVHSGHLALRHQLEAFRKINESVGSDTLVQRMHGLLKSENGHVHGLLLSHIDCKWHGIHSAASEEDASMRPKWAAQIRQSVERLHAAGVVWGYADPGNVLIDRNNDAWIVGCGNGYTKGWTPKGLAGTKEGDWHAVEKILGFQYVDDRQFYFERRSSTLNYPRGVSEQPSTKL